MLAPIRKNFIIILFLPLLLAAWTIHFNVPQAGAQQTLMDGDLATCRDTGNCQPNDLIRVGVKATQIMFGFVGSVVLLFFVYGGLVYLTAAGSKERISKGTQIIKNATFGLIVVFLAYTIVGFVFRIFGVAGWENFATTSWLPRQ